jgi:hypothetical protein
MSPFLTLQQQQRISQTLRIPLLMGREIKRRKRKTYGIQNLAIDLLRLRLLLFIYISGFGKSSIL